MSDSTPLRCGVGERCCARSEGEPSPHHIGSFFQQGGRRRRHCPRRIFEGNGFDVWSVVVQGHGLLVATGIALRSGVSGWRVAAFLFFLVS